MTSQLERVCAAGDTDIMGVIRRGQKWSACLICNVQSLDLCVWLSWLQCFLLHYFSFSLNNCSAKIFVVDIFGKMLNWLSYRGFAR